MPPLLLFCLRCVDVPAVVSVQGFGLRWWEETGEGLGLRCPRGEADNVDGLRRIPLVVSRLGLGLRRWDASDDDDAALSGLGEEDTNDDHEDDCRRGDTPRRREEAPRRGRRREAPSGQGGRAAPARGGFFCDWCRSSVRGSNLGADAARLTTARPGDEGTPCRWACFCFSGEGSRTATEDLCRLEHDGAGEGERRGLLVAEQCGCAARWDEEE